ncbi:MAG TPA: NADH-quinone oxidoreductase subunit NuoH [Anaerolineaceae bacterium]|nr:NADH-quinone oxidoreductase subunit NuoH [Anaerolineaceae bacterium]
MSFFADPINFISDWLSALFAGWGLASGWVQFLLFILGAGVLSLGAMVFTVFLIWLERKLGGRFQDRIGPNRVGPWGIFQTIADMLKIFTKEYITPIGADPVLFNLAPVLAMAAVLAMWAVIPLSSTVYGSNINIGVLYVLAVGALGELGIILAGFGSNNKYALLGGFRAVAMLISYEVPLAITLLVPVMLTGSMGLNDIAAAQKTWFILQAPVAALVFFIASIAENGRAPFDLIEADSEIVAGFNIEYSGLKFGMYYVADFLHAFTAALIFATIFLGGWRGPGAEVYPVLGFLYLLIKTSIVYFLTIAIRFSLPRLRIDQMMAFNWKYLTPLALVSLLVTALIDKTLPAGQVWLRLGALLFANLVVFVLADRLVSAYNRRKAVERMVVSEPRPVAVTIREKPAEVPEVQS